MASYQRILEVEVADEDKIFLWKAGKFLKAYIQSFKLRCRIIQKLNRKVVSLGFPESALNKYTYNYLVETVDEECISVHFGRRISETSFDQWLEMAYVHCNVSPQYTPSTSMIEHQPVKKRQESPWTSRQGTLL